MTRLPVNNGKEDGCRNTTQQQQRLTQIVFIPPLHKDWRHTAKWRIMPQNQSNIKMHRNNGGKETAALFRIKQDGLPLVRVQSLITYSLGRVSNPT